MERRAKKIAAALAGVTALLAEQEASDKVRLAAEGRQHAGSAWSLAGRLALMDSHLARGHGDRR